MTRSVLAPALLLALALPAAAQGERLAGRVVVSEDGAVAVAHDDALTPIDGPLTERLGAFAGLSVELSGRVDQGRFEAAAISSPREAILPAHLERTDGALWVVTPEGRFRGVGRTDLLGAERRRALLWVVEDDTGGPPLALIEAVEAETTSGWTILRADPSTIGRPTALVRGRHRSAWLLAERDGWRLIRRGDREGWVRADRVAAVTPPAPPAAARGLIDHLPD